MSVTLKQISGAQVQPVDDARLYDLLMNGQIGVVEGCEITHLGSNQLQIASGWGVCQGRVFVVEQETINANVSTSGTMSGRLLLRIDITADTPAGFITQVASSLPELTQEDINGSGTIYEIELARYNITQITISDLVQSFEKVMAPAKKPEINTVVFTAGGWSNTAPYTQTVPVVGILQNDNPFADVVLSNDTAIAVEQLEAWRCISDIAISDGIVTARCLEEKPGATLNVRFLITR